MSDDNATPVLTVSPDPAVSPPEPPLPPDLPTLQPAPEFAGTTFAFNLREALIDLDFTVPASVEEATFGAFVVVAVDTAGRVAVAVSKADNPRSVDELAETSKARKAALEALGVKSN